MKIFEKLIGGNVLYYPGCMSKFVTKDLAENYRKILRKIGIDFIELKDLEVCCGSPVLNAGYKEEATRLAEKNFKVFKEHSVKNDNNFLSCLLSNFFPRISKTFR
jgi:Fe-S oxidoreductase